jgi:hypothetical protein
MPTEHQLEQQKMEIRYGRTDQDYPYHKILCSIEDIQHVPIDAQALLTLEKQISRVKHPVEKEWLKNGLDFQLSANNLGYCVKA